MVTRPRIDIVALPTVHVQDQPPCVSFQGTFYEPEVFSAYANLDEAARADFAARAFRIGTIALQGMGTTAKVLDLDSKIQRWDEIFLGYLVRYFGRDGIMEKRLEQALGPDGDLAAALNHLDKGAPGGKLVEHLRALMDPTVETSGFGKMNKQWQADVAELKTALAVRRATDEEARRGTRQGLDFQNHVLALLEDEAEPFGDRVEDVSTTTGASGGKKGDFVSTVSQEDTSGALQRIVVEVKDTPVRSKTAFLRELDEAMENRGAHVALGVVEAEHAADFAPFRQVGPRTLLVSVAKDSAGSVELRSAYRFARMLAEMRAGSRQAEFNVAAFQEGLDAVCRHIQRIDGVRRAMRAWGKQLGEQNAELQSLEDDILREIDVLSKKLQKVATDGS